MAILEEARGKAFLDKCKGVATILAAITALVLGILNWFKDVRDPRVKVGYQELAKQVENLSGDTQKLSKVVRQQAEEISTIQNWIIRESAAIGALPGSSVTKILKSTKMSRLPITAPPARKPVAWDVLQGLQK
jgi:hypothetical protein